MSPRRHDERDEVLGINRRNLDLVFADYRPGRFRALDDKLLSKQKLEAAGVAIPATIAVLKRVSDLATLDDHLADHHEVVLKPAKGWGGRGILILERTDDGRWHTPGGRVLDEDEVHAHAEEILNGSFSLDESEDEVIVEERIHAHEFLEELYPHGLSDLRVVVEDGEPIQAMLRVPTNASDGKANLHGGGLGLGIDLATGRVVRAIQAGREVTRHPDTEVELLGREIPAWPACLDVARAAALAFDPIRYLGVDIVLDARRGPLVLEVNARPGLAIQVANGRGQPVRRRRRLSAFDRFTQRASWIVLLLLAVAPWSFEAWQLDDVPEVRAVRPEVWTAAAADTDEDPAGVIEWSDESAPVSSLSEQFGDARAAAAAGDTMLAARLYHEAAEDSSLMPFALNNLALIERSRGDLAGARSLLEQALARHPEYGRGVYNLGLVVRDLGEAARAEALFRLSLSIRPSHARSWGELGELLLARGAADSARIALEQAVRFDPDAIGDRRRLAQSLVRLDRPGEAAARFAEAMALAPSNEAAALGWVDARLDQAARDGASPTVAMLDSLRAVLEPHLGPRASIDAVVLAGELDWWSGDPIATHETWRRLPVARLEIRWLIARAALDLELGAWDDAQVCLDATSSVRTERLDAALLLGRRLEDDAPIGADESAPFDDSVLSFAWRIARGDSTGIDPSLAARDAADPVERAFVDAASGGSSDWSALTTRTPARLRRGRIDGTTPVPAPILLWAAAPRSAALEVLDRSFEDFRPRLAESFLEAARRVRLDDATAARARERGDRLLRTDPRDPDVIVAMVGLELDAGDGARARGLFERLDPVDRDRLDAQRMEGRLWLEEGELRAARRRFATLARRTPLDPEAWTLLALAQRASGNGDEAVASFEEALRLTPEDVRTRERLARTLMDLGRYDAAAEQWRRLDAFDLEPGLARSVLFNLALALQRQDRFEEAISVWDRLLAVIPDQRSATFNRALALERLGRTEAAIAGFERVLVLDPGHAPSREKLLRLRTEGGS